MNGRVFKCWPRFWPSFGHGIPTSQLESRRIFRIARTHGDLRRVVTVTIDLRSLASELRALRRGRACLHPALTRRLGPTLRTLTGVASGDSAIAARRKIATWVDLMLHDDDIQLGLAVTAALALHRAADHRDLAARERWLADELNVHERTARRRVRDAFEILVERCAESADESLAGQDRDLGTSPCCVRSCALSPAAPS